MRGLSWDAFGASRVFGPQYAHVEDSSGGGRGVKAGLLLSSGHLHRKTVAMLEMGPPSLSGIIHKRTQKHSTGKKKKNRKVPGLFLET